jgi:DivIVA domain-containing protein
MQDPTAMKLTPLDIRKQDFEKSLRGYDTAEVRNFLDIVATQWEEIADERRRLEDKVADLKNKLEHYERVEEALQEALQTARDSAEDKVKNAEREAELIIEEAKAEAREIRQDAKEERDSLKRHTQKIDDRRGEIVARLRSFLMAEMELLARFEGDDPIGFIKLLPAEERKKLQEAGMDLENISPNFEEVGESEDEGHVEAALDEELFGEDAAGPSAEEEVEDRMTAEEEDELSAFFEDFASEPADEAGTTQEGDDAAVEAPPLDEPDTPTASPTAEDTSADTPTHEEPVPAFDEEQEAAASSDDFISPEGADDEDVAASTGETEPPADIQSEFAPPEEPATPAFESTSASSSDGDDASRPDATAEEEAWSERAYEEGLQDEDTVPRDETAPRDETDVKSEEEAAAPPFAEHEPLDRTEETTPSDGAGRDPEAEWSPSPASEEEEATTEPSSQDDEVWSADADEPSASREEPEEPAPEPDPQREFRVNSIFSAPEASAANDDTESTGRSDASSSTAPAAGAPSGGEPSEERRPEASEDTSPEDDTSHDAEGKSGTSATSEEIERIRRILKGME